MQIGQWPILKPESKLSILNTLFEKHVCYVISDVSYLLMQHAKLSTAILMF